MQLSRLFEIVYILMREKGATAQSLAERFEVSTRTIYRDVETLAAAGIPIYASRGRGGGLRLLDSFVLKSSLLTGREQDDLLAALEGFAALGSQNAGSAIEKLSALFDKPQADWIKTDFSDWNGLENDKFETIKAAILDGRMLGFTYYNTKGETRKRLIAPQRLWFKHRNWYLSAYCMENQALRLFRLSRISEVELLERISKETREAMHRETLPELAPTPYTEFQFRLEKPLSYRVHDEFHHSQVCEQEDGSFLITMRCPYDDWIIGYFLSFGDQIEVLQPTHTRELLKKKLKSALAKYT